MITRAYRGEKRFLHRHKDDIAALLELEGILNEPQCIELHEMFRQPTFKLLRIKKFLMTHGVYLMYEGYNKYTVVIKPISPIKPTGVAYKSIW